MKQAIIKKLGQIEVVNDGVRPDNVPAGGLLVKTLYTSVGAEHVDLMTGKDPRVGNPDHKLYMGLPLVPESEIYGIVEEVGSPRKNMNSLACFGATWMYHEMPKPEFKSGDLVVSWGPIQAYNILDQAYCAKVSPEVPGREAVGLVFGGTAFHAVQQADLRMGESILITGQGPLGLMLTQYARISGARKIIATDIRDDKLEISKEFGATDVINVSKINSLKEAVLGLTDGYGVDCAIEASGVGDLIEILFGCVCDQGRVVPLAVYAKPVIFQDLHGDFYTREVTFKASRTPGASPYYESPYCRWTWQTVFGMLAYFLAKGDLRMDKLISHEMPLEQIADAITMQQEKKEGVFKIVIKF